MKLKKNIRLILPVTYMLLEMRNPCWVTARIKRVLLPISVRDTLLLNVKLLGRLVLATYDH